MPLNVDIPRLKYLLARDKLSIKELAELVGCSAQYMYDVTSKRKRPSKQMVEKIAKVFRVGVDEIVRSDGRQGLRSLPSKNGGRTVNRGKNRREGDKKDRDRGTTKGN